MMTVEDLMEALKKVDKKSLVFINGIAISGVAEHTGRYNIIDYDGRDAHNNVKFRKTPKGKQNGVTFTHITEGSDGKLCPSDCWTP
jgi:hypothetical protein